MSLKRLFITLPILIGLFFSTGCQPTATPRPVTAVPVVTSTPPPAPTATTTPEPTATPLPPSIWLPEGLPASVLDIATLPEGWVVAGSADQADLVLEVNGSLQVHRRIYALVAPFPTITDEIAMLELKEMWQRGKRPHGGIATLALDPADAALFTQLWGPPSGLVKTTPAEDLLEQSWKQTDTWAIIPFEDIQPRWKVMTLDGQNPLHKDFDEQAYGLKIDFGLSGKTGLIGAFLVAEPEIPVSNRLPERLTTVMLTGVTALVRGTASTMEGRGMTYPAQDIGDWLREADILHINNEIPFVEGCPAPFPWTNGLVFCSQPRYIELLDYIGTDVMDLSGDHFADWGPQAMLYTLDLYAEREWPVYGGGANIEEAKQPALFEHNGNRIAFIGCNYKSKGYATASETNPGAVHCDPEWLYPAIEKLVKDGYLPIVTFQHEEYYEYIARPQLQEDFRGAAQAGAIIVSGSQAHQPHALEFTDDALLHYGLGNLFFDQVGSMASTNTAFIDRHVFYNGHYLGVELISIRFVDYARSRPTTADEREALLQTVFEASGWLNSTVQ